MMSDTIRLESVSPQLADLFWRAPSSKRRQAVLNACEIAVSRAGLEGGDVRQIMESLRRSQPVDKAMREKMEALSAHFDDQYFQLEQEDDEANELEALILFSKARAAASLAFALSEDVAQLHEAIYEAIAALDDPAEVKRSVEKALM